MGSRLSSTPVGGSGGIGTVTSVGLSSAGGLHSVSGSPVTTSGTLALALATQAANTVLAGPTSGGAVAPTMRALVASDVPAVNPSALTGSGTVPLAALSGITTSQLDAAAAITSAQIAALDAAKITTGTLPLARLSGITTSQLAAGAGILGSQLDAAAAIASGQITSLAASKLTGTNTLPDGVLSTNVPLLNAGNTFTAAQTTSASLAGVLAQINNSSTTGAGLVIGSTTVASAGAGKIAPALACTQTVPATANYGLLSVGGGVWDGSTTGKYAGNSAGQAIAINLASGATSDLINAQIAGADRFKVGSDAYLRISNTGSDVGVYANGSMWFRTGSGTVTNFVFPTNAVTMGAAQTLTVTQMNTNPGSVPFVVKGLSLQTADLVQIQDVSNHTQFAVANSGSGASPVWGLKIRAVANAESMGQAHTLGAYSGKAIQVLDDAAATVGWIPIYA